jgi:chromosome segregation protein
MIFLKRFKATGFKSFAQNIDIDFSLPMAGIVGPNGSGKSNIVDAIK